MVVNGVSHDFENRTWLPGKKYCGMIKKKRQKNKITTLLLQLRELEKESEEELVEKENRLTDEVKMVKEVKIV